MHPKIFLKPGKEKPVLAHHHWIFSGAVLKMEPEVVSGGVVDVYSADHKYLGTGYYNSQTSIAVRMLTFEPAQIDGNFLWNKIYRAWQMRQKLFADGSTNCYRILFSEGDFLPGLIIDRYNSCLVIQIQTLGIDRFREQILEILEVMMKPEAIFEKSEGAARQEEGLESVYKLHYGALPEPGVVVEENGLHYLVDIPGGQKTGFFLDQRENRLLIRQISRGRLMLNCFGYTGGFAVNAAFGGATRTVSVESSAGALALTRENFRLNNLDPDAHQFHQADVFQFLRDDTERYDLIVLDPPAFAKRQASLSAAYRGYKDINLNAMKRLKSGGHLLSCSCSYYIDQLAFQKILFMAAVDAGREVQILGKLPQPADHPINIFHPESEYLKAVLCRVY
jgi:23S rRNA (cytosine1962-C5)-methyltransferase